jgi:hypothetical protein
MKNAIFLSLLCFDEWDQNRGYMRSQRLVQLPTNFKSVEEPLSLPSLSPPRLRFLLDQPSMLQEHSIMQTESTALPYMT